MSVKINAKILACLSMTLGLALGCVDPEEGGGGSTGGTSLYVFDSSDGASNRILVYSDVAAFFENETTEPSRRMGGTKIDTVKNLGWGGMCFDPSGNRLYLVSEAGDIIRIEYARSQNGTISNPYDIFQFGLGASDSERLSNGKFGQASFDARSNTLYVTETNSSEARIWAVSNPNTYSDGAKVSGGSQLTVSGDKGGTGVAAHNGTVYGYFDDGNYINPPLSGSSYSGPRLRKGSSSSFNAQSSLVIGDASHSTNITMLAKYGSLAVDQDGKVYFARHLQDASISSGSAILQFGPGLFSQDSVSNLPPDRNFANISNLRVISHARTKEWLAGALSGDDEGKNTLWIWRSPSLGAGSTAKEFQLPYYVSIRGIALDGSN